MMIALRFIHIVAGVFWAGSVFYTAVFLLPSVLAAGPAGGAVMQQIVGVRKFPTYAMVAAILTVLAGLGMYGLNAKMSHGSWPRSTPGIVYGIGGLFAIVTVVAGATFIAPTAEKLGKLGAAIGASGGPPTPEQRATMASLQNRLKSGSSFAAWMLLVVVICMSVARYL